MKANSGLSPELAREIGKAYFFNSDVDLDKKNCGLKLIVQAHFMQDPEATYLVARLLLDGVLSTSAGVQEEHALTLMCSLANNGCIQARAYLNAYCEARYKEDCDEFSMKDSNGGAC